MSTTFILLLAGGSSLASGDSIATNSAKATLRDTILPSEMPLTSLISDTSALGECKCSYNRRFTIFKKEKSTLDAESKTAYLYAIMSSNTYTRESQFALPGWKRVRRVYSEHGFGADVYVTPTSNRVVIAFRGTDATTAPKGDWFFANIAIGNKNAVQYSEADTLFKQTRESYPNARIETTGHSLGGALAIHVALRNDGVNAVAFDPSPRFFSTGYYTKYANQIEVIYEGGEVLSLIRPMFSTLRKIKYDKYVYNFLGGNAVKEHSIEQFARCMYGSINADSCGYEKRCKDNTLGTAPRSAYASRNFHTHQYPQR